MHRAFKVERTTQPIDPVAAPRVRITGYTGNDPRGPLPRRALGVLAPNLLPTALPTSASRRHQKTA